ncbi:Uma2 family endonuclease [Paracraurococcus lichenis]|uniref:Uma2 family endonuclease n=1 Tax=Paracraurococcus lichenis TaxID=3064888 RepID=A0ABT9E0F5_9PROT|nr:Uma2 family endonuclease [Paracraurococcus sp. LOR1-02]MDO9709608.1 Uma2 family endonuclease [Paracraurococcus sp. LOR1-02]
MTAPADIRWSEASFFAWLERQEARFELVDGEPRAMVGATQRHDRVVMRLLFTLEGRLRGSPCRTGTSDTAIRIPNGNIRYPDAAVDCGRFEETSRTATAPTLVAEVFSPSTALFDQTEKLEEYRTVPGLRHILLIDPDQPRLRLHSRGEDGHWTSAPHAGLEAVVPIPALGITLPLADLYEGLTFRPPSRLVPTDRP